LSNEENDMLIGNKGSATRWTIAIFTVLAILGIAYASKADAAELELDYGRTIIRGPTDIGQIIVIWPNQIGKIDLWAKAVLIGDYNYGGQHYRNQIGAFAGFTANVGHAGISFGVGTLQNKTTDGLNSGDLNFNCGLQYRFGKHRRLVGRQEHISNAGSHDPNTGRDAPLAGWRFGVKS